MFGFEKLEVWGKAIEYADRIYAVTKSFPDIERFGLISQLRRASVSISANIAEGSSRSSKKDVARFVEIAYGSTIETISHMHISKRQQFLTDLDFEELYTRAEELTKMLSGLRANLLKSKNSR